MNIAIDATESFWPRLTGTGVYTRQLLRALVPLVTDDVLTVLGIRRDDADCSFIPTAHLRLLRSPSYRSIWSQVRLPLHLVVHRYDLLHVPGHKLPAVCPCRSVVTIHDLAVEKFPETFEAGHRQRLRWFTRNAVRRADHIIAISECTKRDICTLYGRHSDDVTVVYHGVDHAVFRPDVTPAKRSQPYVLTVGAVQPRKNLVTLIRAFGRVAAPLELVIAGQRGWMWQPIEDEARRSPAAARIHFLGYVPEADLPGLYVGAVAVAMPSLYEGFGLPLLEAMACGAPVIAANASCFPEVAGDAAWLVPATDEPAWAEAITELARSESLRAEYRRRGLARAQQFSWQQTAQETLRVYHRVGRGLV